MSEPAGHDTSPSRAAARSACPVQLVPNGPGRPDGYLVTGYAEARQALGDARLSKDTAAFFAGRESTRDPHPALSHHMLASDPPEHTRLRKPKPAPLRPRLRPGTPALPARGSGGASYERRKPSSEPV
ncbi:hypothetical protein GA0115251_100416 [Streptomyces sp. TverLS-915]|uniref:hypothetical protein n=1 Tax=Streptomyces sp. NPDC088768 TaxID=3365894 RepID=UPI00081E2F5E|nr:hypothetical protein GA0115251_100416 [Streptomyces sp. TverLS-915]